MSSSTSTSTSSDRANEDNKETAPEPFPLKRCDILSSMSTNYMVLNLNGEGGFSNVVKCVNLTTTKLVAIKIHKNDEDPFNLEEVEMLKAVRALDPEKKNIVAFLDNFRFNNLSCLAFEILDKSLDDLMDERKSIPLSLNEIRPVTEQLLVAFEALKGIGILHTDLKPDNVMLVNQKHQPFKIKLIDFGLAIPVSKVQVGMTMQATSYRAPEVTLGLPLSGALDMWGVGCIMSFLYFGCDIFSGDCAYHRMKAMVHMLGQPEDHVLSAGLYTFQYFSREEGSINPEWRLKSPEEYEFATGVKPHVIQKFFKIARNLEDAVESYPEKGDPLEYKDRMEFLSLLKSCLHMDAAHRITPRKALKRSFITMVHLVDQMDTSAYADDALKFMAVSLLKDSDESDDSLTDSETDVELTDDQASDSGDGVSGTGSYSHKESGLKDLKSDQNSESSSDSDIERFSVDSDAESSSGYNADIDDSSDEDDINPRELRLILNDIPAPTGLESGPSTSSERHSDPGISSHENTTGPSAATNLHYGVRDSTTPTKEELGDAATSSNDGAAAAIIPDDVDDVKKKKKKNLLQKTCKFFSRVKARVVSIITFRKN